MRTLVIVTVVLSLGLVTLTILGVLAYLDLRDRGDIEDRLAGADLRMEDFGKGLYQLENSVAGMAEFFMDGGWEGVAASENLYDDDGEYAYWTPYALFEALGQTDREMSRLLTAWSGGDFRMTDWFYETVEDLRQALHNLLDVLDLYRAPR